MSAAGDASSVKTGQKGGVAPPGYVTTGDELADLLFVSQSDIKEFINKFEEANP